ncbi:MAG: sulfotransferase domain-containing protein [Ectothiorhodospiraceae bacterium]|nr:sulfotransferase domain-containing protein [Chromatiales bacterium]MCP5155964.1 sulfotransferase domain-containing protein [Ectothiorhodospiraceae bacterium]
METRHGRLVLRLPAQRSVVGDLQRFRRHLTVDFPGVATSVDRDDGDVLVRVDGPPRLVSSLAKYRLLPWPIKALGDLRRLSRRCYRNATGWMRDLPDFLIIGAPRCGTTALYSRLAAHSCVWPAASVEDPGSRFGGKELHFFNARPEDRLTSYRAHFPLRHRRTRALRRGLAFVTGEATPTYIFEPGVAERVHAALPQVKVIALLRDPVERAYSHYHATRSWGFEPESFERALAEEPRRLAAIESLQPPTSAAMRAMYAYLSAGQYAEHLERWLALFPPEQVLVIAAEDYYRDPGRQALEVLRFLGIEADDDSANASATRVVAGATEHRHGLEREPMAAETRAHLRTHFRPHNARLTALLGRDFGWDD